MLEDSGKQSIIEELSGMVDKLKDMEQDEATLGSGLITRSSKGRRRAKWRQGSCVRACRNAWRGAASP